MPLHFISPHPSPFVLYLTFSLLFISISAKRLSSLTLNLGPSTFIPSTTSISHPLPISLPPPSSSSINPFVPLSNFRSSVRGRVFSIPQLSSLSSGYYDLTLAFIQSSSCVPGAHVFDVLLNKRTILSSLDIFVASSNRCNRPLIYTFHFQKLPALLTFRSRTSSFASVAYISAIPSSLNWSKKCIRSKHTTNLPSHLAHAVPGSYSTVTDWAGIGSVKVFLDGRASHSHYTHIGKRPAKLVSYIWTLSSSGLIISTKSSFTYSFPVGITTVSLAVVDDACNRHVATTTITITTAVQPGAYCYFYKYSTQFPAPNTLYSKTSTFPFASAPLVSTNSKVLADFDFSKIYPVITNKPFNARCFFFIKFKYKQSKLPIFLQSSSKSTTFRTRLYTRTRLIADSNSHTSRQSFVPGLVAFELQVSRTFPTSSSSSSSFFPRTRILISNTLPSVLYDQTSVLPILSNVMPKSASLRGGNIISVSGFGLYWPLIITFRLNGKSFRAKPEWRGSTSKRLFIRTPKLPKPGIASLVVSAKPEIKSNALRVSFSDACDPAVFVKTALKFTKPAGIKLVTSATLGNNGALYLSSAAGKVHVIYPNVLTFRVRKSCHSPILYDNEYKGRNGKFAPRAALGLTLDPRDTLPRPYVSLSTILWPHRIDERNRMRWANGAIARLKHISSTQGNICLQFDKYIVRNLPVSRRDHAVNSLLFTQQGDLLISLGGHTNAGLPAHAMGGAWETYLSASVLIARLSKGEKKFNGIIKYVKKHQYNPRLARPISTADIRFYVTGVRNLYSMTMLRDGRIIGIDMGSNCEQGNVSSSCNEYNEKVASMKLKSDLDEIKWTPGRVIADRTQKTCRYGPSRADKILHLQSGKYYGHPNLQRGVQGECKWIDPLTNQAPSSLKKPSTNYQKPFAMVYSAKTGIREYGANLFCGELRGDLILSQYSEQSTWRLRLGGKKKMPVNEPYEFIKGFSGMAVEETIHGDLLLPRYKQPGIFVARAITTQKSSNKKKNQLTLINALPFRHGLKGGTPLMIGGWGFKTNGMKVLVGNSGCTLTRATEREIECIVPPRKKRNQLLVDVKVIHVASGRSSTLSNAVLYMAV